MSSTFTPDTGNIKFQLAAELVNQTSRNIFLTGKAGTGKTTFLKFIREQCPKQKAVLAPTGVAAINAGGVTIHSFLQLPFAPFIPSGKGMGFRQQQEEVVNQHSLISRLRFNNDKRKLLQQLELLIIDEISMVRCDLLDAVDTVLRHIRKRPHDRFGGVQVLFIGDMFQLPPVVKEADWQLLSGFYESPYFFSSQVLRDEPPVYIEFDKIYRQSDETFIRLLNQVRNNELDAEGAALLDRLFKPSAIQKKDEGYIILTTHNEQARTINNNALQELPGKAMHYKANIKDDFPANAYPAEEALYLKDGAQVMFIKNDTADRGKRYFNGKIGVVQRLEEKKIFVQCKDETSEIEVTLEKWDNIRYTIDKTTNGLKEEVLGSFEQFPLRLAWAITIHKSQGLTFDKVIIDAGEAFAPGQVYVALSRCTSMDGLVLKSRLQTGRLFTDKRIVAFSQSIASSGRLQQELEQAKSRYARELLLQAFSFSSIINSGDALLGYIVEHTSSFNEEALAWTGVLLEKLNEQQQVADKFHVWLNEQFLQDGLEKAIAERSAKAATHFTGAVNSIIQYLEKPAIVTDSKLHAKEANDFLKEIFTGLITRRHGFALFAGSFSAAAWHEHMNRLVVPAFSLNTYAGVSSVETTHQHPLLHRRLKEQRDRFCEAKDQPIYLVATSHTLAEMARYLPQTKDELMKISGFGEARLKQYGQAFLDIITEYCNEHNLESLISEKPAKRERKQSTGSPSKKIDTYAETFRLFKEGKSILAIAAERKLSVGTIEGHLTRYVAQKEIQLEELVSKEVISLVEEALKGHDGKSIIPIKEKLGEAVTYGEIRMVMAGLEIGEP